MACQVAAFPSRPSLAMITGVTAGSRKLAAASSVRAGKVEIPEKVYAPVPPRPRHPEVTHTLPPQKLEIFKTLEKWAESDLLPFLKPVDDCWQPQDFLPDPTSESFHDEVAELRRRSRDLPDDYLVCLVGDMVTEEALPTYQTFLNNLDGIRDETGASLTPWAVWTRAWTAEENRHGDLLNKYLYLTGRVNMRKIEKTIQYLMCAGMVLPEERFSMPNPPKFRSMRLQEYFDLVSGFPDGEQPVQRFHLHVVPGAGDFHLPRQHGAAGEGARRRESGSYLRHHCGGREAARGGVRQDRREAVRGGSERNRPGLRRQDEEEGLDAGMPHVRRPRRRSLRALLGRGAAGGRVHRQGLRRHSAIPHTAVEGRGAEGAIAGGEGGAGVLVRPGAEDQEVGGEGAGEGQVQGRGDRRRI